MAHLRRIATICALMFTPLVADSIPASAQKLWDPNGVPVAPIPPARPSVPTSVGDGGGCFVTWTDDRVDPSTDASDAYVQRLLPTGLPASGWPPAGLLLSDHPSNQYPLAIALDGTGGALIFWEDRRHLISGGSLDIYGQRVTSSGAVAPGWVAGGTPICTAPGHQALTTADWEHGRLAIPDGAEGAFLVWQDHANSGGFDISEVHAQHVTGAGTIAPGWPVNGLPVCVQPGIQTSSKIIPDGAGGMIFAWDDERTGVRNVYALRINADGTQAPGWALNGNPASDAPGSRGRNRVVPDGAGGALFAWLDLRTAPAIPDPYDYFDVYAQHLTASGAVAPGWPSGGVAVRTAPLAQDFLTACSDGAGGMFIAWTDQQDVVARVSRITGDGTVAPGWPPEGKPFATQTGGQYMEGIVADEVGGAYLVWENFTGTYEVYAQRITPQGDPVMGWPAAGLSMTGPPNTFGTMCSDGLGGAIVVWGQPGGLYAQRLGPGGPTPVQISLVSAEAEAGVVRLTWYAPQGSGITASVERRTASSDWVRLGAPDIAGDGTVRYEDRTVSPGGRYAYRLGYSDGTGIAYTNETWVEVPIAARFALRGLMPNPSAGDAVVRLSLASDEPGALELYDVGGRLVSSREVGSLGAGSHELRLGERGRLAAGVYTVRLWQGGLAATTRAVVVR